MYLKQIFAAVLLLVASATVHAQTWQLSGFADPTRSYRSENPDDPAFRKPVNERKVVLAVSDESGRPVVGLQRGSFQGFVQSCDEFSCRFLDMSIVSFPNNPNLTEERPGLYVLMFRVDGAVNPGSIFVRVLRPLTTAEKISGAATALRDLQKAQIVMR